MRIKLSGKTLTKILLALLLTGMAIFLLDVFFPLPAQGLNPPKSLVVRDCNGQVLRIFLAEDGMLRFWNDAQEISAYLKRCVILYEDRWFYCHPGFNPWSLLRALVFNIKAARIVQGGSTITMQVARLMEPKPRTYFNKCIEIIRAIQLELHFSKEGILNLYLNLAPYGGNLVGCGSAAYAYFQKPPLRLSLGEAAALTLIPQNPNQLRADVYPAALTLKRAQFLKRYRSIAGVNTDRAQAEKLPGIRAAPPFEAPHLTDFYFRQRHRYSNPIQSAIDLNIQKKIESIAKNYAREIFPVDVANTAIVVIDNRDHSLRALVGSADFFDTRHAGQVNGALAWRSPGSTLKPFIYALAMAKGLTWTHQTMPDVPIRYGSYEPQNFDGSFNGAVSLKDALIRSLNVPAVNLTARLGEWGLYTFLKKAGVSSWNKPYSHYGLSIALGGADITLLELSNLYSGLANGGRFYTLRWEAGEPNSSLLAALPQGIAWVIADILSELKRPDLPAVWEMAVNRPKIAWKTGTSYGHKDAWSIGFNPHYTVGVWVGNSDGTPSQALVGVSLAAPIMFDVFQSIIQPNTWSQRRI